MIGHPAALVGGMRALLLQALHPLAMAGVAQHSNYLEDPMGRLRRTAGYVSTVTFGTHAEAEAAAAVVRGVHRHVHGTDPVTGRRYSASDPATMVWVHCVEVHSFLAAYRAYARPISRADQDRYLAEQVEAAVLLGTPRHRVPDSVRAYRDYFASVRGELCTSPEAEAAIGFVRRPSLPDLHRRSGSCSSRRSAPWATPPPRWCPPRCASWPGCPSAARASCPAGWR